MILWVEFVRCVLYLQVTYLPDFLMDSTSERDLKKFIFGRAEVDRTAGITAEAV